MSQPWWFDDPHRTEADRALQAIRELKEIDVNPWPTTCERCGAELSRTWSTMSKFNTQTICGACKTDEEQAPGYAAADALEAAAVQRGDYNYRGVGLSAEDRTFLAARRASR